MNPNAKQLPIDHLDDIVGSIVSTVPTDAIYVFGSYARGEQTPCLLYTSPSPRD